MICACRKRGYVSKRAAILAHPRAGFRLRAYLCDRGCSPPWHVANADKDEPAVYREMRRGHGHRRYPARALAPALTLEQLEAIAKEKRARASGR